MGHVEFYTQMGWKTGMCSLKNSFRSKVT